MALNPDTVCHSCVFVARRNLVTADLDQTLQGARTRQECLSQAQARISNFADRKQREVQFQEGDFRLLSAEKLHLNFDGVKKPINRCFGPFEIIKNGGNVADEVKLPNSMAIHDVLHVSLLKLY